tara:strand:- start:493 stop:636 length:144 start_codon:yes stop_codon:yes gene_type:complete
MFKGPNGAGKGDKPRPMSIDRKEYEERWKKIFNKHRYKKAGIKDGSK